MITALLLAVSHHTFDWFDPHYTWLFAGASVGIPVGVLLSALSRRISA